MASSEQTIDYHRMGHTIDSEAAFVQASTFDLNLSNYDVQGFVVGGP